MLSWSCEEQFCDVHSDVEYLSPLPRTTWLPEQRKKERLRGLCACSEEFDLAPEIVRCKALHSSVLLAFWPEYLCWVGFLRRFLSGPRDEL